jgi:RNA polymerase-binding transcription factor DksA
MARKKAERRAAEMARKKATREREQERKRLAKERERARLAQQKVREQAAKEKAKERERLAAARAAEMAAKDAERATAKAEKERIREEQRAKKEAERIAALEARRKPEPPPKPKPVLAEKIDGIQTTKDFDFKFLSAQRESLIELRKQLTKQADRLEDEANALIEDVEMGDVQFDEEGGEGDTMVVERERDLVLSAQARQQVEQIDTALARLATGDYGYSEHSGLPIPRERLQALPWTTEMVQERVGGFGRR